MLKNLSPSTHIYHWHFESVTNIDVTHKAENLVRFCINLPFVRLSICKSFLFCSFPPGEIKPSPNKNSYFNSSFIWNRSSIKPQNRYQQHLLTVSIWMFLNENFPYYMNHVFTFKKHFNSNSQISDFCQMIIKFWEVFRSTESELLILSPMWRSIDFIILFFY